MIWVKRNNNPTKSATVNFIKLQNKILTDHLAWSVWIYQEEVSPVCWSLGFCIKDIIIFLKVLNCSVWSVWISLDSATDENKSETGCCCIRVLILEVRNIWTRARSFLETESVLCKKLITVFMALVTKKIQLYFKLTKPCYSSSFADDFFVNRWHIKIQWRG